MTHLVVMEQIGNQQSSLNKFYSFEMPEYMKRNDKSKARLEVRLNNPALAPEEVEKEFFSEKKLQATPVKRRVGRLPSPNLEQRSPGKLFGTLMVVNIIIKYQMFQKNR